jgi:hypothetical protein
MLKNKYFKKFTVGYGLYLYYTVVKGRLFSRAIDPISHEEYLAMIEDVS